MKMKKHVIHEKQIGPLYTMILLKDKFWPLVDDIGNIGVLFLLVEHLPTASPVDVSVNRVVQPVKKRQQTLHKAGRNPFEMYDNNQVTSPYERSSGYLQITSTQWD